MSGTRWLSREEQETWRSFLGACQALFTTLESQLQRDAGIPQAYYEILVRLSESPGHELRMSQLAEAAFASKSRVSHAVARLEERGWVRRAGCPTDRRGQVAQLTQEGYAALAAAAPGHVSQVRAALFDALTPDQVSQLRAIADAVSTRRGGGVPVCCGGEEPAGDGPAGEPAFDAG